MHLARAACAARTGRSDVPIGRSPRDFALCLGEKLGKSDTQRLFAYPHAKDVFKEHRESTRGRDLDITGLSYTLLESRGPQQWPFPTRRNQRQDAFV
jgi:assimilatory nitrate reductase catalytic subunit